MSQRDAHESYAVAASRLHWIALIMLLSLAAVVATMYLLFKLWLSNAPAISAAQLPPAPRLQAHPVGDLAAERAREHQQLDSYAWKDATHATARIPIDRAMQLLALHAGEKRSSP